MNSKVAKFYFCISEYSIFINETILVNHKQPASFGLSKN